MKSVLSILVIGAVIFALLIFAVSNSLNNPKKITPVADYITDIRIPEKDFDKKRADQHNRLADSDIYTAGDILQEIDSGKPQVPVEEKPLQTKKTKLQAAIDLDAAQGL